MGSQDGYSLLELLVTMTIVTSLAAIAVPEYKAYRKRAFDVRAQSDLQNVALAEEAYFIDFESYHSCNDAACADLPGIRALSPGVRLTITATLTGFIATASHPQGTGRVFVWDPSLGGLR